MVTMVFFVPSSIPFSLSTNPCIHVTRSMRDLSAILADCRTAFGGLSELEKAAAAEALVGKNAMSG